MNRPCVYRKAMEWWLWKMRWNNSTGLCTKQQLKLTVTSYGFLLVCLAFSGMFNVRNCGIAITGLHQAISSFTVLGVSGLHKPMSSFTVLRVSVLHKTIISFTVLSVCRFGQSNKEFYSPQCFRFGQSNKRFYSSQCFRFGRSNKQFYSSQCFRFGQSNKQFYSFRNEQFLPSVVCWCTDADCSLSIYCTVYRHHGVL